MPGQVIRAHADVENQCERCHRRFEQGAENKLCIECHEDVEKDIRTSAGFHGRAPGASGSDCRACHSEHKGRDADVVGLDVENFDHTMTDLPLKGAHANTSCSGCHQSGVRYREAPKACIDCHREDDRHDTRLGEDCGQCHSDTTWSAARFDHDATRFRLEGRHVDVECGLCHPGERFKKTASDCNSCHRRGDRHRGRFGPRCETCHSPEGWDRSLFHHDRDTSYRLDGSHRGVPCGECHRGILYEEKQRTDCFSCHRADDLHRGRNGVKCEECHSSESWQATRFDHDRLTKFPLRGGHTSLACEACHTASPKEEKLETSCISCHRSDDVHRDQQGSRCGRCHDESGWGKRVFFDHDITAFPLLGLHAVAACEQCHLSAEYRNADIRCSECHRDDFHSYRLGTSCGKCHTPNGWKRWRFDHTSQTRFVLSGAHEGIDCHACHRKPARGELSLAMNCNSCHGNDDRHYGSYGRDCGRCHNDTSWDEVELGR